MVDVMVGDFAPGSKSVTLWTRSNDPDGTVTSVSFYRESNGTAGLQTGSGGDLLLGTDTVGSDGWTNIAATTSQCATGMPPLVAARRDDCNGGSRGGDKFGGVFCRECHPDADVAGA